MLSFQRACMRNFVHHQVRALNKSRMPGISRFKSYSNTSIRALQRWRKKHNAIRGKTSGVNRYYRFKAGGSKHKLPLPTFNDPMDKLEESIIKKNGGDQWDDEVKEISQKGFEGWRKGGGWKEAGEGLGGSPVGVNANLRDPHPQTNHYPTCTQGPQRTWQSRCWPVGNLATVTSWFRKKCLLTPLRPRRYV